MTTGTLPASLQWIEAHFYLAGRHFIRTLPPLPNQSVKFVWDGKDAYGQPVTGSVRTNVRIDYVHEAFYADPAVMQRSFAAISGMPVPAIDARTFAPISTGARTRLSQWDARRAGLGGWTLNVHHTYDSTSQTLYLGDGRIRSAAHANASEIRTIAGNGDFGYLGDGGPATDATLDFPYAGIATGPDGTIYFSDHFNDVIRAISPEGIIYTVAGGGNPADGRGDGLLATDAKLLTPYGIALDARGTLYIADRFDHRVRGVDGETGIISTVAGNGTWMTLSGDGGLAIDAGLGFPDAVAVGPDGYLYIMASNRIRRVDPDGYIETFAGGGSDPSDGIPALLADLDTYIGFAIARDGSMYINDGDRIRKIAPDGVINTVAGDGDYYFGIDGVPATATSIGGPEGIAVTRGGALLLADAASARLRRVSTNGIINTLAGIGTIDFYTGGFSGDLGPARAAELAYPGGVAEGPDGAVYLLDSENSRIRKIAPAHPNFSTDNVIIPSQDAFELYVFDVDGRHLETRHALTGAILYQFTYEDGLLTEIEDGEGNLTTIERDGNGEPLAIRAPGGQETTLGLDSNGYLNAISNPVTVPAPQTYSFTYSADGLLQTMSDPKGNDYVFTYDEAGRLLRDEDPAGGVQTLERDDDGASYSVTHSTLLGRATSYEVDNLSTETTMQSVVAPTGLATVVMSGGDGVETTTRPDGTTEVRHNGPDPRFGMAAPLPAVRTLTTPEGLQSTVTMTRSVVIDPGNPFGVDQQTEQIVIGQRVFETSYDAGDANEPPTLTRTTPVGRQIISNLDSLGRVVGTEVPGLYPVTTQYDGQGRLSSITQGPNDPNDPGYADRRVTAFSYKTTSDNENRLLDAIVDAEGRETSFDYDDAGRVIKQTLPGQREIEYTYDANGNLTSLSPPGRPAHEFDYSPVNLESEYNPPQPSPTIAEPRTQFVYNEDRQLEEIVRPDGQTVDFEYGATDGRLASVSVGSDERAYTYYGAAEPSSGQLKTLAGPDALLTFTYDGSLLLQESWDWNDLASNSSVARTYDDDFRIISLQVDSETPIAFGYDDDGMLTQAGSLTLTRDPDNGFVIGTSLSSGGDSIEGSLGYSPFGEIATYAIEHDSSEVYAFAIDGRDKLGRITDRTETVTIAPDPPQSVTRHFEYDPAGRLWRVCPDATCSTVLSEYLYDQNGNRTSGSIGGDSISATYDDQDRLLSYTRGSTTHTYTYSENGELESKTDASTSAVTTYSYDAFGNLRTVTLPDDTEIEYLIDGRNRRVGKKVGGIVVQRFLFKDGLEPIAELDGGGNLVAQFVYGAKSNVPDYLVRYGTGAGIYRVISDHLGSPHLVIDIATGEVAQRINYDEFGNATLVTGTWDVLPFGLAGGLYDPDTGLVRFGARDYDPQTGRWTAKDPIRFWGGDTNLYGYVLSDPVNGTDILGLSQCRTAPLDPIEAWARQMAASGIEAAAAGIELAAAGMAGTGTLPGVALGAGLGLLGAGIGAVGVDILPGIDLPWVDDGDPCECTP